MSLPEVVKVGGITYSVYVTENMSNGIQNVCGECDFEKCEIRIAPQNEEKMQRDFMHEIIHAIAYHMGYTKHREKKIEALAAALYMVAKDNPGIFDFCNQSSKDSFSAVYTDSDGNERRREYKRKSRL